MLPCYLGCALAMLLDRLCGEPNISLGKWVNVFDTPTIADTVSSNHVPWTVAGACYLMSVVLLFSIRVILARENKRRDAEPRDDRFDDVHVMRVDGEGKRTEVKVSKVRADSG